jgi:hypothetical protein
MKEGATWLLERSQSQWNSKMSVTVALLCAEAIIVLCAVANSTKVTVNTAPTMTKSGPSLWVAGVRVCGSSTANNQRDGRASVTLNFLEMSG